MLNFLKIICIWICCVSCLFGRIQLPAVGAVPFEYFDDHEQFSYDLDTEQSKAKYDTRLLSEQLLKDQQPSSGEAVRGYDERTEEGATASNADEAAVASAEKDDDLQPHERAASCYSGGRKYTHGQKVPRLDACEVCLCMDGEIFCWWEKCAKSNRQKVKSMQHTNLLRGKSAATILRSTAKTATKPTEQKLQLKQEQQQQQHNQKYEYADATEEIQMNYSAEQHHYKKQSKKKLHQKQQKQQEQQKNQQKHEQHIKQLQQHPHKLEHRQQTLSSSSSSSSKILSFPENLPSLLYYDYKTEEHQHHQHQHHQQHLEHQLQRQQQKQQQQQARQRQQQHLKQQHEQRASADDNNNDDDDNDDDNNRSASTILPASAAATATVTPSLVPSSSLYRTSTGGDENGYDELEVDSDILPEPPTKRPKAVTAATTRSSATTLATTLSMTSGGTTATATVEIADTLAATSSPLIRGDEWQANDNKAVDVAYPGNAKKYNDAPQDPYNMQQQRQQHQQRHVDDAFHRWLASTETNSKNTPAAGVTNLNGAAKQQTADFEIALGVKNTTAHQHEQQQQLPTQNVTNAGTAIGSGKGAGSAAEAGAYFRSTFNDYSGEFNGSVVNIDIMLTAAGGGDEQQQQQQQRKQQQHAKLTQQEDQESLIINNPSKTNTTMIAILSNSSSNSNSNVSTTRAALLSHVVKGKLSATPTLAADDTAATTAAATTAMTTLSPDRQCNVMGTLYKIGDVLPQDTGNCLQCVCSDGSGGGIGVGANGGSGTGDDDVVVASAASSSIGDNTPRVTCSPHNCPPLVLPDLFDATGY